MDIKSIEIKNILTGQHNSDCEGVRHIKVLSCLSIVQSVYGYYEIGLEGDALSQTEEGGAFIAPTGMQQEIVHHNGSKGYMKAHWVFMNVVINNVFSFEDVFDIPLLLSAVHADEVNDCILRIKNADNICEKYISAYKLVDILIKNSKPKHTHITDTAAIIKQYINDHYSEQITNQHLADAAICSVPNLYHIFNKQFQMSPHNYINMIRLEKASVFLESTDEPITKISEMVGFDDPAYFSKLFSKRYQLSPKKYRDSLRSVAENG